MRGCEHSSDGPIPTERDRGFKSLFLHQRVSEFRTGVRGRYQELANTSWPAFNLGNYAFNLGNYTERTRGSDRAFDIRDVPVPAFGAVVLVRWD
jgi:1,4-alpha-glucan branching enzyme